MLERSEMTKRYAVPALSFATFLPCMVSRIVKPGPTVPLTVFAVAAEPMPVATSAAAATALSSKGHVRVILLMSFASFAYELVIEPRIGRPDPRRPGGDSHRGDSPDFRCKGWAALPEIDRGAGVAENGGGEHGRRQ